jgi:transposase
MYAKVRRLRLRDGLSISEIARRTSLSRNTVKEWLQEPVKREMRYVRPKAPRKINAHLEWLEEPGHPTNPNSPTTQHIDFVQEDSAAGWMMPA